MRFLPHRTLLAPLVFAAVALATLAAGAFAAAPRLKAATAYEAPESQGVHVSLVTSAANPNKIQPGAAPLGSQFAVGGIYVSCPGAPRSGARAPFVTIPFPGLTLTLTHSHYSFSKKLKLKRSLLATTLREEVPLTVLFTGTVIKPTVLRGTVKVTGKQCATTAKYSAKAHPNTPVAPGA